MCLYIKELKYLLLWLVNLEFPFFFGGGGVGRTMGNELFSWDGLSLFTVVMQALLQFSPVTVEYMRLFFSNFWTVAHFSTKRKLSFLGTINFLFERLRSKSLSKGAARSYKKRNFGTKLKHCCGFCLEVSFFSCVKKNHRSGFWLVVSFIHVWKKSFAPLIG